VQEPLWTALPNCTVPLLLVSGQRDAKFAGISRRMATRLRQGPRAARDAAALQQNAAADGSAAAAAAAMGCAPWHEWVELKGVGHALHVEAPIDLLRLLRDFLARLERGN
jgi:isochorismate synthase / 2-succinyl-5-enolpyruvyl-6-hydroxy-3-cyclohexene-1-carboxylate synthase / 2-succinyl-6-hydroxy-2,4-cyclohexadiene-1-carboxylate synthase / o-succinylbenzoate synthase